MREQAPLYAMPFGEATARFATRFADVERLISDERLTMNITAWDGYKRAAPGDPRARFARVALDSMSARDGAEHTRLRRLVNQGFTPRAMVAFDASLHALVHERIARIATLERFDLHRDLSQRVPDVLLVVDDEDTRFFEWMRAAHAAAGRATRKHVPRSRDDSTRMLPQCAATIRSAM